MAPRVCGHSRGGSGWCVWAWVWVCAGSGSVARLLGIVLGAEGTRGFNVVQKALKVGSILQRNKVLQPGEEMPATGPVQLVQAGREVGKGTTRAVVAQDVGERIHFLLAERLVQHLHVVVHDFGFALPPQQHLFHRPLGTSRGRWRRSTGRRRRHGVGRGGDIAEERKDTPAAHYTARRRRRVGRCALLQAPRRRISALLRSLAGLLFYGRFPAFQTGENVVVHGMQNGLRVHVVHCFLCRLTHCQGGFRRLHHHNVALLFPRASREDEQKVAGCVVYVHNVYDVCQRKRLIHAGKIVEVASPCAWAALAIAR
eukprot:m.1036875 g.1036875  ORF g.1036875 m.1036875 type:complete len:313 (+) comp24140_c1_seq25:835-1773(+)